MRILIIEDERTLADIISTRLKKEKYSIDICLEGEEGLYNALSGIYDLIILDVMLPNISGFEILQQLRLEKIATKVIMLTAKTEIEDKLTGFNYGADDYLTKPFHLEELVARISAQLRKDSDQNILDYLELGDIRLYLKTSTLLCLTTNETIPISCKEFLIIEYLIQNKNIILSKEQIYDHVWGLDNTCESNNLEAYLSFLRKKLKIIGSRVEIKALRGLGYKLEVTHE